MPIRTYHYPKGLFEFWCVNRGKQHKRLLLAWQTIRNNHTSNIRRLTAGQSNAVDLILLKMVFVMVFHLYAIACRAFDCLPLYMIYLFPFETEQGYTICCRFAQIPKYHIYFNSKSLRFCLCQKLKLLLFKSDNTFDEVGFFFLFFGSRIISPAKMNI